MQPYWLAATAHPPATAARVAKAAKVSAIPTGIGNPLRTNGRSARAKTKGRTGSTQELRIVRTTPQETSRKEDHDGLDARLRRA